MVDPNRMMNPYIISPTVVKIQLDQDLSAQCTQLNARLNWRPLTTNLESCEEAKYLYFRITLTTRPGASTFAGFATGAPFMLTRDKDVKKRAFFLRHWVRSVPPQDNSNAPLTEIDHIDVAAQDDRLLVRVDIDRPLVVKDTFKSIPFATWMFQVVQLDAVIQGLPGVRFAFAIERTVTVDEREIVAASRLNLPSKGPKVKQSLAPPVQPRAVPSPSRSAANQHISHTSPTPRPARPLLGQPVGLSPLQQSATPRPNMTYTPVTQRPPAASYQPSPYAYSSSRPTPLQMRQNVAPRPPYMAPQMQKAPSRSYTRPINAMPASSPQSVDNQRPVMHPYLRLWEDRDLDDPYEPIFVTEDHKFEEKARKHWLVEQPEDFAKRFDYQNLFGMPTSDYPPYYFQGQAITEACGNPDLEIVVHRKRRVPPEASVPMNDSGGEEGSKIFRAGNYNAAVVKAADFNSQLIEERVELKKFLDEDAAREEEESDEQEEEDDGEGDSSD